MQMSVETVLGFLAGNDGRSDFSAISLKCVFGGAVKSARNFP